jgi:hypothetical protein
MKPIYNHFDFTRSWMLGGVGLLVCCAPPLTYKPVQFNYLGIGQYFYNTGFYLHAAVESQCPEIANEFRQKQQLELHLPV